MMMGDTTGSREKTTQWLEDVLQSYYTLEKAEAAASKKNGVDDAGDKSVALTVTDFDIGPGFSGDGRLSTLSDLLSLRVSLKIDGELKTEHLVVKIPPNDRADREMAQMAQVDKREIQFYTDAAPQLQEWIRSRGVPNLTLSIPKCYFAKYHAQQVVEGEGGDDVVLNSDAESVLVLQDLRPLGFAMRDFNTGLSLGQARAAIRQIAIIHASSWAFQQSSGTRLDETWDFCYRPRNAASAYQMMIEQGFPTLADFLERQQPDGPELLKKLKSLHPKAAELLCELLVPPAAPAPSCLTHMDFWCNNLLFRQRSPPDGSPSGSGPAQNNQNGGEEPDEDETECRILDWQMIALSRPTHDVALLLFTSLTPELRHRHQEELLQFYWNVFKETATSLGEELTFDFTCLMDEFRKSQLLALLLVIGSIDLALDAPSTEERLVQAIRDMSNSDLI